MVQNRRQRSAVGDREPADNLSATVQRAMALLDVVAAEPRGLTLTEAARRASLHKTTTLRLLGSLQRAGLVVHDPGRSLYRPGLKLVWMAEQVLQALDLRTVAHGHVQALAQLLGQGVLAGVLEGAEVVYVDHVQGSDGLRVHREVGGRRSVHLSSIGRAILAYLPPAGLERILAVCRFEQRTPHTIVDRDAFLAYLAQVRRQGWALLCDEDRLGVTSFAAPVFDHTDQVVGAIGVTGPTFLLRSAALEQAVRSLIERCQAASAELGYTGADTDRRLLEQVACGS